MFLSLLMRIHLIWPNMSLPLFGEIKPEGYLSLLTMHGTIMVFFVLTTAPQGGFGNYFLPIQIGAADMALPSDKHAVVLGDFPRIHRHALGVFRNWRSATARLDRLPAAERPSVGRARRRSRRRPVG